MKTLKTVMKSKQFEKVDKLDKDAGDNGMTREKLIRLYLDKFRWWLK